MFGQNPQAAPGCELAISKRKDRAFGYLAAVTAAAIVFAACARESLVSTTSSPGASTVPTGPEPVLTPERLAHMRAMGITLAHPKPVRLPAGMERDGTPLDNGQEVTLDFEGMGHFWEVGETYAALGIVFSNADVSDTSGGGYNPLYPPHSGTSYMSTAQGGTSPTIGVSLSAPVRSVGVYATSYQYVTLTCYDEAGTAVGTDSMDYSLMSFSAYFAGLLDGTTANHHLQVVHDGIRSCAVTGRYQGYALDDFEFNKAGNNGLQVTCTPGAVVRGAPVSCAVTTTRAGGVHLRALVASTTYGDVAWPNSDLPLQPGDTFRWRGTAVTGSVVRAVALTGIAGSDTLVASDSFQVSRRFFTGWRVANPVAKTAVWSPRMREEPWQDQAGWHFVLGLNVMREVAFQPGGDAVVTADTVGPNAGIFYFVRAPSPRPDTIFVHPQLHGVHGLWWSEQTGNQMWPLVAGDSIRECDNRTNDIANLAAAVDAHEGVTMLPGSHWANVKYYYERIPMDSILEGVAVKSNSGDLLEMADSIYQVTVIRPLAVADSALDAPRSYDNVWRVVGCKADVVMDGH